MTLLNMISDLLMRAPKQRVHVKPIPNRESGWASLALITLRLPETWDSHSTSSLEVGYLNQSFTGYHPHGRLPRGGCRICRCAYVSVRNSSAAASRGRQLPDWNWHYVLMSWSNHHLRATRQIELSRLFATEAQREKSIRAQKANRTDDPNGFISFGIAVAKFNDPIVGHRQGLIEQVTHENKAKLENEVEKLPY